MPTIQATLFDYFKDCNDFTLKEAKETAQNVLNLNVKIPSIRARIHEGIDKGLFKKVARGVYKSSKNGCNYLLINGDGRDLSMFADNSIDAVLMTK